MKSSSHIVILTGAGVSAESGLPTFRGNGGLWEGRDVMKVATPEAFAADPKMVQRFYNERRQVLLTKDPNPAHAAIARLQRESQSRITLITQNIDDLHERAGSGDVWHIHGELLRSRCLQCGSVKECRIDLGETSLCGACGAAGTLRPHVVWFGEIPLHLDELDVLTRDVTLFVAMGTSGQVYPAANFVHVARARGARCIEFNLEASGVFDEFVFGPAAQTVPAWVDGLLQRRALID